MANEVVGVPLDVDVVNGLLVVADEDEAVGVGVAVAEDKTAAAVPSL